MVPQKVLLRHHKGNAFQGTSKAHRKATSKPSEAPQRSVKMKIKLNFLFQYNFQKCPGREGLKSFGER